MSRLFSLKLVAMLSKPSIIAFLFISIFVSSVPLFSQEAQYLFPSSSKNISSYFMYPIIPLKKVMRIAEEVEREAILTLKQRIASYCQSNKKNSIQVISKQYNQWKQVQKHFQDQLKTLLKLELKSPHLEIVLQNKDTIRSLRLQRQNATLQIWQSIHTRNHTQENECLQYGAKLLKNQKAFHTKPLYLALYRFWKEVPLIKRQKIIKILSNTTSKPSR